MSDDSEKADTLASALELVAGGDWLTCSDVVVLHRAAECLRVQKAEVERLREQETWLKAGHKTANGFLDVPSQSHIVDKVCIIGWERDELREKVERLRNRIRDLRDAEVLLGTLRSSEILKAAYQRIKQAEEAATTADINKRTYQLLSPGDLQFCLSVLVDCYEAAKAAGGEDADQL